MTTDESLSAQRAAIGLKTPSYAQKQRIWRDVRSSSAGITKEGYRPLPSALKAHAADVRGVAVSGGWRAGKSLSSAMEAVTWLPYASLVWLIARDYDLSRQEFLYLAESGVTTGLVSPADVQMPLNKYQPCALRSITGCLVETRTLADFRKIAARPPDLIVVCEPGLIDNLNLVMELLWGRVSERRGRIWLAGTSDEASEEWYEMWEQWRGPNPWGGRAFSIPTWQNRYRYPHGRKEAEFVRYEEAYGLEALMAHYGGVPASPRNLVLRGFWSPAKLVTDTVAFDPSRPLEIAIDPNYSLDNRYSVEAIQWDHNSGGIYVVDEVALANATHDDVIAECMTRPWWPYVQGGVIDPHAGDQQVFGGYAPISYWTPYVPIRMMPEKPRVATTVQALKEAMQMREDGTTRLRIAPGAERLIWEAARWRQNPTGAPETRHCDALKALGYWLVEYLTAERAERYFGEPDNIVVARDWQVV